MSLTSPARIDHATRRLGSRQRCLYACRIVHGADAHTLDGVVRDLSETGARLRIASSLPLPKVFRLILAREGRCHEVEVVWRRGQEIGVAFIGTVDLSDATDASVRLLRRLWAEMAGRAADVSPAG